MAQMWNLKSVNVLDGSHNVGDYSASSIIRCAYDKKFYFYYKHARRGWWERQRPKKPAFLIALWHSCSSVDSSAALLITQQDPWRSLGIYRETARDLCSVEPKNLIGQRLIPTGNDSYTISFVLSCGTGVSDFISIFIDLYVHILV